MKTTRKWARTTEDYKVKAFGWDIVVPKGSLVSNSTATGPDDNCRFWEDWKKVTEEVTGTTNSILAHDINYHGLNLPAKICTPWQETYPGPVS